MSELAAYGLIGAYLLFQLVTLSLAFKGKTGAWIAVQLVFGISMFTLAEVQNSGRAGWLLMFVTAVTMATTTVLSGALAFIGRQVRSRRKQNFKEGIA